MPRRYQRDRGRKRRPLHKKGTRVYMSTTTPHLQAPGLHRMPTSSWFDLAEGLATSTNDALTLNLLYHEDPATEGAIFKSSLLLSLAHIPVKVSALEQALHGNPAADAHFLLAVCSNVLSIHYHDPCEAFESTNLKFAIINPDIRPNCC